jgi:siderophore synthetase component
MHSDCNIPLFHLLDLDHVKTQEPPENLMSVQRQIANRRPMNQRSFSYHFDGICVNHVRDMHNRMTSSLLQAAASLSYAMSEMANALGSSSAGKIGVNLCHVDFTM